MNEELRMVVNDIRKYLRQNEDDFETNQGLIGMKYLFWGFAIIVWTGLNFSKNKYTDYN